MKDKKESKITSIVKEIAYDLGIDRKIVKQVLLFTFKEVAITLLLKSKPVMIRRFAKFVIAATAVKNIVKSKQKQNESKRSEERTTV